MDAFAIMGFIFGVSGLTFAFIAIARVEQLKKEVQQLRNQIEGD